jgi:hypothetical protein
MYRTGLSTYMKNIWHFTRAYHERGNSVPLPSYVLIALTNPEMTRRIREQRDPAVHVIGHCVEALVVNKLAVDINSRTDPITNVELECLSAIVGIKSDDVMHLLSHPGAIEFTNMAFLALDGFYSPAFALPLFVLDVVQQTFSALSRTLPLELNAKMRPDTQMNISDGQHEHVL